MDPVPVKPALHEERVPGPGGRVRIEKDAADPVPDDSEPERPVADAGPVVDRAVEEVDGKRSRLHRFGSLQRVSEYGCTEQQPAPQ